MAETKVVELGKVFNQLMGDYKTLRLSLDSIYNQSQNIRVLSFNSSIEAARAGKAGAGFHIISDEIRTFSEQNDKVSRDCNTVVDGIESKMYNLIGIRTADVAFDVIDKIDRNLFERFCDVQSWATFKKIVDASLSPSEKNYREAELVLERMVKIYEVYYDSLLLDMNGQVVCSAVHKELNNKNMSDKSWFKDVCREKRTVFSDMYFSPSLQQWAVAYTSPVFSSDGAMVGVLSNRFNWNYILDIVNKSKVSSSGSLSVVNQEGTVIASRQKDRILRDSLARTDAFQQLSNGVPYGYLVGKKQGSQTTIIGYAHTSGYNSYPGKNWSVIIEETY